MCLALRPAQPRASCVWPRQRLSLALCTFGSASSSASLFVRLALPPARLRASCIFLGSPISDTGWTTWEHPLSGSFCHFRAAGSMREVQVCASRFIRKAQVWIWAAGSMHKLYVWSLRAAGSIHKDLRSARPEGPPTGAALRAAPVGGPSGRALLKSLCIDPAALKLQT